MSSKIYVLDGALLECNQGFVPAKLLVTQNQKVKIQGKFKATDMDVQVPATFGQCKLKPTSGGYLPCIPALQKWTKTTKTSTLGGSKKFLYEDSECMCGTGGKVTIMQPMQINTGGNASEKFKEIAMTIPGAMMGNDKAPKVVESYWMDEAGKEKIDRINYGEKATMFVQTENMEVGEKVEVRVKAKNGKEIKEGKSELLYAGNVKADGTVALDLVCIDKPESTENSSTNSTPAPASTTNNSTSSQSTSEKVILETGVVNKGNRINENGKIIIVNSKGKRAYDWIYADAPSESLMKKNGMSDYDVKNINLTKSYPTAMLKTEMKAVLWSFSDIEDGFGKNGRDLANHFFDGHGSNFIFDNDSNPVREIKDSDQFKNDFVPALEKELVDQYKKNNYVTKNPQKVYNFRTSLPYYSALQGLNPNVNEIATFVGGIQGCLANYEIYEQDGEIGATITNLSFFDTFGAGWEDGGADGMAKQWIPGLVSMFCLQHFKNVEDKSKFQPFAIMLNIEL
ncbi:PAAR-like protein [uncultured Aquimarina sp.]|uniref:PAAR-like protein n=1 Tax=uncultured Aquimarina sp. TaxID=575652 RepID=UPI002634A57B|nr:PAAR-like protein [uncultured Aquimarina sp.]